MKVSRLLVLVGASLVFASSGKGLDNNHEGAGEPLAGSQVTHKGTRVDCLGAFNEARSKVGLPKFSGSPNGGKKLPIVGPAYEESPNRRSAAREIISGSESKTAAQEEKEFLKSFCTTVLKQEKSSVYGKQANGTYMYAFQDSPNGSCAAAVEYWRGAEANFPTPPPAYTAEEPLYKNDKNVSFVGLFNLKLNPTVDCAIISCQPDTLEDGDKSEKEEQEKADSDDTQHAGGAQPGAKDASSAKKHKLLCLSAPAAFEDSELPFT
ncbi:hypothetical protein Emag_007889 [Eimeria magna]